MVIKSNVAAKIKEHNDINFWIASNSQKIFIIKQKENKLIKSQNISLDLSSLPVC